MAAGLVTLGVAFAVGWGLYAAWLTPEVYAGGVGGAEVYALPISVPALGGSGYPMAWLAIGGLAAGGAAAALAGLRDVRDQTTVAGRARPFVLIVGAGLLACLVPAAAWGLLIAALGLAASALAPAAGLACWSERATPRAVAAGATVGLTAFSLAPLAALLNLAGPLGEWGSAVAAAPAALAAPAHLLVAWLLRSRRASSPRTPPPPGLEGFSAPLPARPQAG